jgi:hypothetical protein
MPGCNGDNGTQPGATRYGQVGEIRVHLIAPMSFDAGELQQVLTWSSSGAWQLYESVSYKGNVGDETLMRSPLSPNAYAGSYASLITHLNETQGLMLFIPELNPDLEVECGVNQTRVMFRIRDESRDEETLWSRCAYGSMTTLVPAGAGPDAAAGRVIQAATLVREYTLEYPPGSTFLSAYHGSVPFGTLARGEDSPEKLTDPLVFHTVLGESPVPAGWNAFWELHGSGAPPEIDWSAEMVLVAAVGERKEAGDSVEVRRVLPVDHGTQVKIVERVPGDFCSPAARSHFPYHVVVFPRVPLPITYAEIETERVPCGVS